MVEQAVVHRAVGLIKLPEREKSLVGVSRGISDQIFMKGWEKGTISNTQLHPMLSYIHLLYIIQDKLLAMKRPSTGNREKQRNIFCTRKEGNQEW
jgi:hypothetical protein